MAIYGDTSYNIGGRCQLENSFVVKSSNNFEIDIEKSELNIQNKITCQCNWQQRVNDTTAIFQVSYFHLVFAAHHE